MEENNKRVYPPCEYIHKRGKYKGIVCKNLKDFCKSESHRNAYNRELLKDTPRWVILTNNKKEKYIHLIDYQKKIFLGFNNGYRC